MRHFLFSICVLCCLLQISVNLLGSSAAITYDKSRIGIRQLIQEINDIGFEASLPSHADSGSSAREARQREVGPCGIHLT